jgi:lyso-ornithine lipid O-acyltransferase
MQILNIEVRITGIMPTHTPHLWVANHISWLDIPLLGGLAPHAVFVSKEEVRSWPLIGGLAAGAGTVFMQRGSGSEGARTAIVEGLTTGRHIVIFPEGTTTDGHTVKRFHARLLQPAIDCQAPLLPIAIRYVTDDGQPARAAAYIDQDHILSSVGRVLSTRKLVAQVHLLETIDTNENTPRRQLADQAQRSISHTF